MAVLGTCVLLAACGSVARPGSGSAASTGGSTPAGSTAAGSIPATATPSAPSSAAVGANAKVSIDVTFAAFGSTAARHYTLSCDPAGGTTPDPAAACSKLLTGNNIFTARPLRLECPMVLRGNGMATITGTYFGRAVHLTIVNGGCDLSSWVKLKSIFG